MKRAQSLSLSLLMCMIPPVYSMNFLKTVTNSISKAVNKIKYGDDCNNPFVQYDKMRSVLFDELKEKYKHSNATEISKEDILELKNKLADKNTRSIIRQGDISSCLRFYNDIYQSMNNEKNNICFIGTIMPVLLKGHAFQRTNENEDRYSALNDFIFTWSKDNVHLMRTLIFHHAVPLKMTNIRASWTLLQLDHVKNLEKLYGNEEGYLKTILTPPDSWLQETKKDIISSMCFFIISLQKLKKENPQSTSYNLPKAVILNCILRELIKSSVVQEIHTAKNIIEDISTDLKLIKEVEKRTHKTHAITTFLENDFESWARRTINPEEALYSAIVKKK